MVMRGGTGGGLTSHERSGDVEYTSIWTAFQNVARLRILRQPQQVGTTLDVLLEDACARLLL